MADPHYENPRLAALYDPLDPDRSDLEVYAAMAAEFGARDVLDIGCGTGTFGCLLAARGFTVTGLDPARGSLDIARSKPFADKVRWVHGTVSDLPDLQVDLVTMTGNVAQVFLTDAEWDAVLGAARRVLRPGGRLVLETRDPARRAWLRWNRQDTYLRATLPGIGTTEAWNDVTDVRAASSPSGPPTSSSQTARCLPPTPPSAFAPGRRSRTRWPPWASRWQRFATPPTAPAGSSSSSRSREASPAGSPVPATGRERRPASRGTAQ